MTPWQGKASPRDLSPLHFAQAAERLGCEPAAIRAVWEVEAAGRHFLDDGSVIRRFEPHHFPRQHWAAIGFAVRQGEAPWRASLRLSSEAMFRRAAGLDMLGALRASSWGAPQIMGFNHAAAGFTSPAEMVQHMAKGAPEQLGAFVQLVEGWGLAGAIRGHDWAAFARRYNGSGQVAEYARRIEAAYRRHSGRASPVVLRVGARGPAVAELQRGLGIADDGAFGPETLAAVRDFQRRAGLPVDGVVGARTWAAIGDGTPRPFGAGTATQVQIVHPPVQETPADVVLAGIGRYTGAAGAVTAAVGGVSAVLGELRETVGEIGLAILLAGGVALAVALVIAAVARRRRGEPVVQLTAGGTSSWHNWGG